MAQPVLELESVCLGLHAMGGRCDLRLAVAPSRAARVAALALLAGEARRLEQSEAELSRFRPESGLCRLNAAAADTVEVSPVLAAALAGALAMARVTGGLCHPALLDCLEAAGYDRTLAELPADGPPVQPPFGAPCLPDWLPVHVAGGRVDRPPGLRLDLGGTAKGWAADQAAARLAPHGPVLVSVGGDLRAWSPPAAPAWEVPVADPFRPWRNLALLHVRDAGVATSGTLGRRWRRDGRWQHHIIDPRTGRPAESPVISATVVAPTALQAEAWAKAVLLLGVEAGLAALDRRGLGGLLVLADGAMAMNHALKGWVHAYRVGCG